MSRIASSGIAVSALLASTVIAFALPHQAVASEPFVRYQDATGKPALRSPLGEHAGRTGLVELDLQALSLAAGGKATDAAGVTAQRVAFVLFPDVRFTADRAVSFRNPDGSTTWVGLIDDKEESQVLLTLGGGQVHGRIDLGGAQYVLQGAIDGQAVVSQIDPASYAARNASEIVAAPRASSRSAAAAIASQPNAAEATGKAAIALTTDSVVKILALYTANANNWAAGASVPPASPSTQLSNQVNSFIADANLSFSDSKVGGTVQLVGLMRSPYAEPAIGDPNASNPYLWSTTRETMEAATQPPFANLDQLREKSGADVIVLFVDGTRMTGTCGNASVAMYQSAMSIWRESAAVVGINCAVGDRTFTHELGHIFGGRHEGDISGAGPEPFTYSQGYVNTAAPFRTLMALGGHLPGGCTIHSCPRINRWSSPTQTYNGFALGNSATAPLANRTNMVATLNWMFRTVAAYSEMGNIAAPGPIPTAFMQTCDVITHGSPPDPVTGVGPVIIQAVTTAEWSEPAGLVEYYVLETSNDPLFQNQIGNSTYPLYRGQGARTVVPFTRQYTRLRACNNDAGCSIKAVAVLPPDQCGEI